MNRKRITIATVLAAIGLVLPLGISSGTPVAHASPPANPAPTPHAGTHPDTPRDPDLDSAGRHYAQRAAEFRASMTAQQRAQVDKWVAALPATPKAQPALAAPSGDTPYGGEMFGGYDGTPDAVFGCSTTMATRSSANLQYFLTSGHCVKEYGSGPFNIDPTNGRFWNPFTLDVHTVPANLGSTGEGGTNYGSTGDYTFIRANKLLWASFAEGRTWDSRIAFDITGWGNPLVGESVSCSCGSSQRLIHGTVVRVNFAAPYTTGPVGNSAWIQVDATHEGCVKGGDSGAPIVRSDHQVEAIVGAGGLRGGGTPWCDIYANMVQKPMAASNQFMAPSAP